MSTNLFNQRGRTRRVMIVGGGIAGAGTALKLCESKIPVLLVSASNPVRAHSVCQRGGFAAVAPAQRDDTPERHFEDTVLVGDFLAHQAPVWSMTQAAADLFALLERLGVPFNRTKEGLPRLLRSGGARAARAAHAGLHTGQQILYALWSALRRFAETEVTDARGASTSGEKLLELLPFHDFLSLVLDDKGVAVGAVLQDNKSFEIKALPADAICLCTGDATRLFAPSTGSLDCTGAAAAAVFRQGAVIANPEFVQYHPTAVMGHNKAVAIGEAARADGARLWLPKDAKDRRQPSDIPDRERDYFLERQFPGFGNLVPSDVAARAVQRLLSEGGGICNPDNGSVEPLVYLDVSHIESGVLEARFADQFAAVSMLTGNSDPYAPLKVAPAVQCLLGGLWVDYELGANGAVVTSSPRNHATSIAGLYAAGDVEYQYHGACRLSENDALSCLYAAVLAANGLLSYRSALSRSAYDLPNSIFERAESREQQRFDALIAGDGSDVNAHELALELANVMHRHCGVVRNDADLDNALDLLIELGERAMRARLDANSAAVSRSVRQLLQLPDMVLYAMLVAQGARRREESRGCHHKVRGAAQARNDTEWQRTTLVRFADGESRFVAEFSYTCAGKNVHVSDAVDTTWLPAVPRDYARRVAS